MVREQPHRECSKTVPQQGSVLYILCNILVRLT